MWNGRSPRAGLVVCFWSVASRPGRQRLLWAIQPLGCVVSREAAARLQEAALELSLPVVLVGGLAVPGCEAAGGGALSGVVNCLAAQVVA